MYLWKKVHRREKAVGENQYTIPKNESRGGNSYPPNRPLKRSQNNQLNRRSINSDQKFYLIGKKYTEEKKAVGENQYTETKEDTLSGVVTVTTPKKTEEKIVEQTNVSPKTVRRAEKYTKAVDSVSENTGINPQQINKEAGFCLLFVWFQGHFVL